MDYPKLRLKLQTSAPGRALLTVMSWLYGAAVTLRTWLFQLRILPSRRLPVKTVCFGNLTAGGTGKTSAVLLAAQLLRRKRYRVAILSRGYRSRGDSRDVKVLLDSENLPWETVGDEPWMMHQILQGLDIPILVSPQRYRAGLEALTHYDPQILLLDDGFQHLRLARDLNILFVNATEPFGGGLLPLGNQREPLRAMRRAHLVVLTHADQVPQERLAEIRNRILDIHPKAQLLEASHRADFFFDLKSQRRVPLNDLKGQKVVAMSAIGDPESFENQLRGLGTEVVQSWRFADHHPYTLEDLRSVDNVCSGTAIVTTFKDITRLPPRWKDVLKGNVLALAIRMEITKGQKTWETELCNNLNA